VPRVVLQNFKTGELSLAEVPRPRVRAGGVLVRNAASVISAGTERAILELARMSALDKARARPDLVKKVLNRAGQEGLLGTARIVSNLVGAPIPLGYSCAGTVLEVGDGVADLRVGQRVACGGLGYANHAEEVFVPRNLTVPVPEAVSFEDAAFATLGAIALHGLRQGEPQLQDVVLVLGLGLIGQLSVQLGDAAGARVVGVDPVAERRELATELGAEAALPPDLHEVRARIDALSSGRGADVALVTASSKSSDPVRLAGEVLRDRGRVVVLGDVGMDIPRRLFYEKELDVRLSRSYGPGRYDASYEERGVDYPAGYVRWTENRNMGAVLDMIAQSRVRVAPLRTHEYPFDEALSAFELLTTAEPSLAIALRYDRTESGLQREADRLPVAPREPRISPGPTSLGVPAALGPASSVHGVGRLLGQLTGGRRSGLGVGVIGTGQFCQGVLLPLFAGAPGVRIAAAASESGFSARAVAERYGAPLVTSDPDEVLACGAVQTVLIATRHDSHARIACQALRSGKHVFVEKPLCLSQEELDDVAAAYISAREAHPHLTLLVGYNRRFAPFSVRVREAFAALGPQLHVCRVNAGSQRADHWTQNLDVGGGRLLGELCHFVDLLQFLTVEEPVAVTAVSALDDRRSQGDPDSVIVQIRFSRGSAASLAYVASGDAGLAKERLEVFGGGRAAVIDNWRRVEVFAGRRAKRARSWLGSAKGHAEEVTAFLKGVEKGRSPVPFRSLALTSATTFAVRRALHCGRQVEVRLSEVVERAARLDGSQ